MKNTNATIVVGCLAVTGSLAAAATPGYEDLPIGSVYHVGDSTSSDGVNIHFQPFAWWGGTWTSGGEATVDDAGLACGFNHELGLNNILASFDFAGSIGSQPYVQFRFGEHGGNINVEINGDFHNVADFIDLDGMMIGGANFHVMSGGLGHDCGVVEIHGLVHKLSLGGQELWIDDLYLPPPCTYGYEDLPLGTVFTSGSSFVTDGILCKVTGFAWWGGTWTFTGDTTVVNTGLACATGNELWLNNSTVVHDFASSVGTLENVSIQFGEYGGNINVEINGAFQNVADFIDLDGLMIGGVSISIPYGGIGHDCGKMELVGHVDTLAIGGQELWLDCLEGDVVHDAPGDTNGDGDVNVLDLLNVIQHWGQCKGCDADLNGDGVVNVLDLLEVIASWN